MWTRAEIKQKAKATLTGSYWQAFLVSLVILITGGSHNAGAGGSGGAGGTGGAGAEHFDYRILIVAGIVALTLMLLRVLIGYAVEVGGRKFFVESAMGHTDLGYLGYAFHKGRYSTVLGPMLLRSIYVFLWFLLFIIPGIVKLYAYRMVPYILADNPDIGGKRALDLSNQMTKGEKWNILVLDLSFIGWFILGALALGVGVLFVQPYCDATNAQLYLNLKRRAIDSGLTNAQELGA